jgi:hypothetical protein
MPAVSPAPNRKTNPTAAAEAPAVEKELAFDMLKRSVKLTPVVIVLATIIWGLDGLASSGIAVALVLVNLLLSAIALSWAAKVSLNMIMVVAMGGFAVRMGLVTLVVFLVRDAGWIDLLALGVSILVTHLGLLFWELRYVSASLAFPGLKPGAVKEAPTS